MTILFPNKPSQSIKALGYEGPTLRVFFVRGAVWDYDVEAYSMGSTEHTALSIACRIAADESPGGLWAARWRDSLTPHGHQLLDSELASALNDLSESLTIKTGAATEAEGV